MRIAVGLTVLAFVLVACGPKINPAYQMRVDRILAEHPAKDNRIEAPRTLAPQPWKVGQWAIYKVWETNGDIGFERLSVVKQDDCGIWVETFHVSPRTKTISQVCFERMPFDSDPDKAVKQALDLVRIMKTKSGDEPVQTIDFSTPQGAMMRGMMQGMSQGMYFDWRIDDSVPREVISVPAGTFVQAAQITATVRLGFITLTSQVWVHPAVPLNGSVRTEGPKGYRTELLAYGLSGAKSEL